MLSKDLIKWIVNTKLKGKLKNGEMTNACISIRRVQQLYSEI